MSRPWMPLWIDKYLGDTAHLDALESGAYMHLIMHYWRTEAPLPDDDRRLARIAKCSDEDWTRIRPTIQAFFYDGWNHKRVEKELLESEKKYQKRAAAGQLGGNASAKSKQCSSNAQAMLNQPQPQPQSKSSDTNVSGADAPSDPSIAEKELFERGKKVLGSGAGGMIANLLRAKGKNIALARSAIEAASTKQNPSEYVAAIIRGPPQGSPQAIKDARKQKWSDMYAHLEQSIDRDRERQVSGEAPLRVLPGGSG